MLGSIMAIGSLAGALLAARRQRPRLRILLIALAGFTVSSVAALAPTYEVFALAADPDRPGALTALTTANAMVQLSVDAQMRGRVMALYMAVFMGGTPLGAPIIGWIGDVFGPALDHPDRHHRRGRRVARCGDLPLRSESISGALPAPRPAALLVTRDTRRRRCRRQPSGDARFRRGCPVAGALLVVAVVGSLLR